MTSTQEIDFTNQNRAHAFSAQGETEPLAILAALNLTTPRNVILVVGGAAKVDHLPAAQKVRLQQFFDSVVIAVAREHHAVIVAFVELLRLTVIAVPIVAAALIAYNNRFDAGSKWILLRANAEAIKREIYRYRTMYVGGHIDIYRHPTLDGAAVSADTLLARQVADLCRRTMRTEVNSSALKPYNGLLPPGMYETQCGDDGFSPMTPDQYAAVRIGDQISYFQKRCVRLDRRQKRLQASILIFIGLGALLAAVSLQAWVPVAAIVATALSAYVQAQQFNDTLIKFNQTLTDLLNLRDRWQALTAAERDNPKNIDLLVQLGEDILETENSGWVRRMRNALLELRKKEDPKTGQITGEGPQQPTEDTAHKPAHQAEPKPKADSEHSDGVEPSVEQQQEE